MSLMLPPAMQETVRNAWDGDSGGFRRFWQVSIKLNDACTLRCAYCTQHVPGRSAVALPFPEVARLLSACADGVSETVLLTGGEPLIYPKIRGVLSLLDELGLPFDVNTGLYVHPRILDRLLSSQPRTVRFSLHTDNANDHNAFTQADSWLKVVGNARQLCAARGRTRVEINSSVTKLNFRGLPDRISWLLEEFAPDDIDVFPVYDDQRLQLNRAEIDEYYRSVLPATLAILEGRTFYQLPARLEYLFGYDRGEAFLRGGGYVEHRVPCWCGSSSLYVDNFGDVYPCVSQQIHRWMRGHVKIGTIQDTDYLRALSGQNVVPCHEPGTNAVCRQHCPLFFSNVNLYIDSLAQPRGLIPNPGKEISHAGSAEPQRKGRPLALPVLPTPV